MAAKTYREILERYDRAKAFGEQRSLADYARHLNDIYQTQDYTEGVDDGWWRRASTRIDQALEPTLGAVTEPIGRAVGGAVGYPEEGATVGRGLPRALIQSAPLYLAGPEAGIPATIAALGLTGAAFGAQTYADTGSPKAAAISGVTAGAMPLIGRFGGGIAGRLAGGERARLPGRLFSDVFGSEAAGNVGKVAGAQFAGAQTGMFGAQVASTYAQRRALGEEVGLGEVLTDPHLWLGQIPFTVYDTVRALKTKPTSIEKVRPFLPKPLETQVAPPKPGVGSNEARAQAEALIREFDVIIKDEKSSPEQKAAATQNVIKGILTPEKLAQMKAVQVTAPTPNIVLSGKSVREGPPGHWRISVDEVMKEDGTSIQPPEHKTVRVISDVPPRFNEQLGVWTWSGPQSALRLNAEWPLAPEPDLPLPGAELPQRDPNVPPTSAAGVKPWQPRTLFHGSRHKELVGGIPRKSIVGGSLYQTQNFGPAVYLTGDEALAKHYIISDRTPGALALGEYSETGAVHSFTEKEQLNLANGADKLPEEIQQKFLSKLKDPDDIEFWSSFKDATIFEWFGDAEPNQQAFLARALEKAGFDGVEYTADNGEHEVALYRTEKIVPKVSADEVATLDKYGVQFPANPFDYVPALAIGAEPIPGQVGGKHKDIVEGYDKTKPDAGDVLLQSLEDKTHVFKNLATGEVIDRDTLEQRFGPGIRQSEDLQRLQQEHALRVAELKKQAEAIQVAEQRIADAKAKQVVVPTKAEEWSNLVPVGRASERPGLFYGTHELAAQVQQVPRTGPGVVEITGTEHGGDASGAPVADAVANGSIKLPADISKALHENDLADLTWTTDLAGLIALKRAGVEIAHFPDKNDPTKIVTVDLRKADLARLEAEFKADLVPKEALKQGATPTQAAETARLVSTTSEIAAATHEAEVASAEAKEVVKAKDPNFGEWTFDNGGIKNGVKVIVTRPAPGDEQPRIDPYGDATIPARQPDQIYRVTFYTKADTGDIIPSNHAFATPAELPAVIADLVRWYDKDAPTKIAKKQGFKAFYKEKEKIGRTEKHGEALKDEKGKRLMFPTKAEAEAHRLTRLENPEAYMTYNAGKLRGKERGFYLAKPEVVQGRQANMLSLDKPTEEGQTLHGAIAEATPQMEHETSPELLGEVSDTFNEVAENLGVVELQKNLAIATPRVFGNAVGLDEVDAMKLLTRARLIFATGKDNPTLAEANAALASRNIPGYKTYEELNAALKLARQGAREFQGLKSPALSSNIPHNEELVNTIGIRESLTKALTWVSDQWLKSSDVYVQAQGRLIRELLKAFPNADGDVDVLLPGTTGWHPRRGWQFWKEAGVRSKINMEHLPYDHAEAVDTWGQNLVHEFTHHATRELAFRDDPAALEFQKVLKEAREAIAASKSLPKGVREAIRVSQKEDHVRKYANGELTLDQLYEKWRAIAGEDTKDWFQVIYGASNDHEFMAQIFGDPQMLAVTRNTKMPKGPVKTVLDFFVEGWNKLFGRANVQDNVLAQVLSKFDSYLVPQRFADGYSGRDYIRDILVDTFGTRDVALASRVNTVEKLFNTGHLGHSILGFQREEANGLLPVTSKGGLLNQSLRASLMVGLHHDVYHATLDLLPEEVPVAQELWWRMNQDVQMAKQTIAEVERGAVPGKVSKDAKQTLRVSEQKVQRMKEALDKQALDIQRLKNLNQLTIEGWEQALYDQVTAEGPLAAPPDPVPDAAAIREKVALEGLQGKSQSSWFARNFALTQFFKEMYPSVRHAVGNVFAQQGAAVDRAKKLMLGFYWNPNLPDGKGRSGSIDPKIITQVKRVRKSDAMTQTTSDLFRYQNKELKGQTLDLADPYVRQELSTYRPEDRDAIVQVLNSQAFRHKTAVEYVYTPFFAELNREYTAHLIGSREVGMQPEVARDFANKLHDAIGKTAIPELAAVGAAELQALAGQMTPDTYIRAIQHVTELSQKTAKWLGAIRDKPGYTPEQRYGKHQLWMLNPKTNKRSHDSSDSLEELAAIQQRKAAQGYETLDLIHAEDTLSPRMGMREEFLRSLEDLDAFNTTLVDSLMSDQPELRSAVRVATQRAGDVRSQIEAASPLPKVSRRFAEGRESINMLDNADQFYSRMNNWMKNKMTRAKSNVDLLSPELQGNRELRRFVQQHVDNFTTPDNPLARKFTEATYFYKLAFDFGNALLESTQFLTTGMSSLVGETGSVGQAFDLVRSALAKEAKHAVKRTYGTKELDDFMEWADRNGHGGHAAWNDMSDIDQHNYYAASGAEGPVGVLQNKARNFSLFFSKRNARIGLLAAYELARSRGMSVEDSRAFAVDVKARGAFDEGKAQRAVGLFGIKSRPVPQLMAALQNYTLGWFSQMALNWKRGFSGKPPAGLTETQRVGAKKAFFYSLAAQAALAGALGLPGVGQGLALLNQATGIDLKGKTLQTLADLFDEDTQFGGTLTGLAMRGIGAYGLPFDPSNRASISVPFLGVDAYKGFNVANLGGAPTATVGDFVEGLLGLARGDTTATAKLLPNVAKRPFQLASGEGDVRDERKTLLYQLSPAERWLQALGLSPSRVQAARDTAEAVKKLNVAAQRQRDSFVDSVATKVRQGDIPTAQLLLQEYLQAHPEVDAQSLARSVAGRVEAQSVPYDWRRDVNPGVELAGLSSRMPSSEVLRRNVRGEVMSQLGLPEAPNLRGDYRAMMLDELLNSDPTLSRSAAVRQLGAARKRPALGRSIWQEQPVFQ